MLIFQAVAVLAAFVILMWVIFMFVGDLSGAPYVPVTTRVMDEILKKMKLKNGAEFWDLGSGDGKVIFAAVQKYGVKGYGVEINPYLTLYCRIKAKFLNLTGARFRRENFYKTDLSKAEFIYFYLFNGTVEKLAAKIDKECKKNTSVASRAFEIKAWKHKLVDTIDTNGWKTYFYKV